MRENRSAMTIYPTTIPITMRAMFAAILVLTIGNAALAQEAPSSQYLSFDAPHPTNKSYAGTNSAAINRQGRIAGTVIYGGAMHGFVRRQNGTFLAVNVPGASQTSVSAINAYNEVVGDFFAPGGPFGFFRDSAGTYTQLAVPNATTQALDVNGSAVVVGTTHDASGFHGFLWSLPSGFTVFEVPGTKPGNTVALAINGTGTVTGYYFDSKLNNHGFIRSRGGRFIKFDATVGGTEPTSINSSGQITGWGHDAQGNLVGFVRDLDGTIHLISVSGVSSNASTGINDSGVVVGFDFSDANHPSSFQRNPDGGITELPVPFANTANRANGINVFGAITGYYIDSSGTTHGWVKTP